MTCCVLGCADSSQALEPLAPYSWPKQEVQFPDAHSTCVFPPLRAPEVSDPAGPFVPELPPPESAGAIVCPGSLENLPPGNEPLQPMEQFIPDLLISPHMLPCKDPPPRFCTVLLPGGGLLACRRAQPTSSPSPRLPLYSA